MSDFVRVGHIRRVHGLKGFVIVQGLSDFALDRFVPGEEFLLENRQGRILEKSLEIADSKPYGTSFLLRFEGMETPEDVLDILQAYLLIPLEERAELEENEFYPDQLLGLEVRYLTGAVLGRVQDVEVLPAHPVLVLDTGRMIAFVKDSIVSVDLEKGILVVKAVLDEV